MGGWSNSIGEYSVRQMDYDYDTINKIHSKEELEKFMMEVELFYLKDFERVSEEIKVPLTELHDVVPDTDSEHEGKGYYTISYDNEDKSLRNWLFREIKKRGWEIRGSFKLRIYLPDIDYSKLPNYYLSTYLMCDDETIKISTHSEEFEITQLEELDWLAEKGFEFV